MGDGGDWDGGVMRPEYGIPVSGSRRGNVWELGAFPGGIPGPEGMV